MARGTLSTARGTTSGNYEMNPISVLAEVEALSDWNANRADTIETTSFFKRGNNAIQMQTQNPYANSQIDKTGLSIAVKSSTVIGLNIYIPQATYDAGFTTTSIQFFFYDGTGTSYWRIPIALSSNANSDELNAGWNYLLVDLSAGKLDGTTPLYANGISRCLIRVQDSASKTNQKIVVDDVLIYGRARPKLAIVFDDNTITQNTVAYPYMLSNNIVGSMYVNSNTVGLNANYVTTANLKTMRASGWAILNHAADHTNLTTLSLSAALQLVDDTDVYLKSNGFNADGKHVAYPYGGHNIELDNALIARGYKSLRSTQGGQLAVLGVTDNYKIIRVVNLGNLSGSVTSLQNAKDYIDGVIRRGGNGCILGHNFLTTPTSSASEWSIANFKSLIDYIKVRMESGEIDVVNVNDMISGL